MGENRGSSHYCHGNTDKSNSTANTTLCESFSETEPKTGRNGDMERRVWRSPHIAYIYPPVYNMGQGQEGRAPFRGQEESVCPVPPSAEKDTKHAGWLGHREQERLVQKGTQKMALPCSTHIAWDTGIYFEMQGTPILFSLGSRWIIAANPKYQESQVTLHSTRPLPFHVPALVSSTLCFFQSSLLAPSLSFSALLSFLL